MYIAEKWELRQVGGGGGERRAIERIEEREREREKCGRADEHSHVYIYIPVCVRCIPSYNRLPRRAGYIVIL